MTHRGPDDKGLYISEDKAVGMGHRRLSIIDLSQSGRQPMTNENRTVWLVFNGEIYNYKALRDELIRSGHRFISNSDTEVIIHLYEEKGLACLKHLNGMFAIAIWDENAKKLVLGRDRVGIKPLYYTQVGGGIAFASEIGSLQRHPAVGGGIRQQAVYDYLTILTTPAPGTMFEKINKVEAGTAVTFDFREGLDIRRYWDPKTYLNNPIGGKAESEAIDETRMLVGDAVQSHLVSDVPVGMFFSGGVDSSLILCMVSSVSRELLSMTSEYEIDSDHNESLIAREIAEKLGVPLSVHKVGSSTFYRSVEEYLHMQSDYPTGSPDIILMYILSSHARKNGTIVCLVGEGGDEIGGYPQYLRAMKEFGFLRYFAGLPLAFKKIVYSASPRKLQSALEIAMGQQVASRRHIHSFGEREKRMMWVGDQTESTYEYLRKIMYEIEGCDVESHYRKILNLEFKLRLPELLLPRVDYPTMAKSVEARVPFLEHGLVEYCLRLPSTLTMKGGMPKYLLKRILGSYLDFELVYRKKKPFGGLLKPFLSDVLPVWFKDEMLHRAHPVYDFVSHDAVCALWREHARSHLRGWNLWTLYALGKWVEKYA